MRALRATDDAADPDEAGRLAKFTGYGDWGRITPSSHESDSVHKVVPFPLNLGGRRCLLFES